MFGKLFNAAVLAAALVGVVAKPTQLNRLSKYLPVFLKRWD